MKKLMQLISNKLLLKISLVFGLSLPHLHLFAQDSLNRRYNTVIYTGFVNIVPQNFNFPLIGFINIAKGDQHSLQLGFININQNNFKGAQISFINLAGGEVKGTQIGFVNTSRRRFDGTQVGYVNTVVGDVKGVQVGFVNTCKDSLRGGQIGFLNTTVGSVLGPQIGFVNTCKDSLKGVQAGFINTVVGKVAGPQIGFVNTCKDSIIGPQIGFVNAVAGNMKGSQIGFVNFVDSISNGIPIGFVSIIHRGGYKCIEVGSNEMYPVNVAVKFGVRQFYTSVTGAFNPNHDRQFALGFGLGSIIPVNQSFYINPEAIMYHRVEWDNYHMLNFTLNLGKSLSENWSITFGPSINWQFKQTKDYELEKPMFAIYQRNIDANNRLYVGLKANLRYSF